MDRHIVEGKCLEGFPESHSKGFETQHGFKCKAITYWIYDDRGGSFCLIEAPSKNELWEFYEKAHGFIPHEFIEVDSQIVHSFLGVIKNLKDAQNKYQDQQRQSRFPHHAYRILLNINSEHKALLRAQFEPSEIASILSNRNSIIRNNIKQFGGTEIQLDQSEFVVTFISISNAVKCVFKIQDLLEHEPIRLNLKIGVHAGNSMTVGGEKFGEINRMANLLSKIADRNEIVFSAAAKKLLDNANELIHHCKKNYRIISPTEEHFLSMLAKALDNNWEDSSFNINEFCNYLSTSKSQLYRKCINATGSSPNHLLREFRLTRALYKLEQTNKNISQTAFEVGFNNPSYFSKCFYKRFGITPTNFINSQ